MNKIFATMAAVSALAVAAPAAAQYSSRNQQDGYQNGIGADANLSARIGQLQTRIQAGVQSGAISRQEAVPLRQQLRQLNQLERQYSVNGLSGSERADLQQRIRGLRQQIRTADGGNQARWDGYDREDGYGRDGQYRNNGQYGQGGQYDRDDRMDRNNDGYDDRDYDRDGRWDDEDGYQQQQPARGGIGGIFDSLLGGGGLRVGQRASGNLYGVPSEYRNQYRDGNGAYYRSDGRQIYQIDARTQTVVRVYPMSR